MRDGHCGISADATQLKTGVVMRIQKLQKCQPDESGWLEYFTTRGSGGI